MVYYWYRIECFEVQPGMWETDPMLEPYWQDPEYGMHQAGFKPTHEYALVISIKPLPLWFAEYPDIVLSLTREEASVMSLQWFPEHDEQRLNPETGKWETVHVPARDVTKEWPDA